MKDKIECRCCGNPISAPRPGDRLVWCEQCGGSFPVSDINTNLTSTDPRKESRVSLREDHISTLNTTAEAIAVALGSDWTVSQPASIDFPSGLIISDGTRELHFYLSYNSDKVYLSGVYPDNKPPHQTLTLYEKGERVERPRIGFSVKRPAPQIARDIERRFLPDYDRVRALVVERMAADEADTTSQARALADMATTLGVERRNDSTQLSTPISDRTGYGDFRASHDGSSWEISLRSVPAGVARQVAQVMATPPDDTDKPVTPITKDGVDYINHLINLLEHLRDGTLAPGDGEALHANDIRGCVISIVSNAGALKAKYDNGSLLRPRGEGWS